MIGDLKPRESWSDDERRMHRTAATAIGIVIGVIIVGVVGIAFLVAHVAC